VYDRLNVELTECGESFYNKMIPGTLDELDKAGILKVHNTHSSILHTCTCIGSGVQFTSYDV
jgi:arginyl-tRNA synthetase